MRFLPLLFAVFFLAGSALAQLPTYDPPRAWTLANGQTVQASVTGYDGKVILFRLANGQRWQTTPDQVSPADREYLADWEKRQPISATMPDMVEAPASSLDFQIVSEDEAAGKFVYRTKHFEFESQGKFTGSLLKEVGRNFEATYELVKALPWGIEPEPAEGEYFRARLFRTVEDYHAAGGLPGSGGVYRRKEGIFLVPFSSIGLKVVGKSYAKNEDNYDTHTLVHELTHEMMHGWLDVLPQWVIEGTAEYTSMLPLRAGRFRVSSAKSGLKDYLDYLKRTSRGVPEPYPIGELFTMSNKTWNEILGSDPRMTGRLYFTAYLLVYYFMELDGKGDRQLFLRYFREVGEMQRAVTDFRHAVAELRRQPGVEELPDGKLRVPQGVATPQVPEIFTSPEALEAYHQRTLAILLNGRTEEQLMNEIKSAYARLGVKL